MALNPQYDAIGKGFVQQYYTLFDDPVQRPNLVNMYNVETSFMTFEGVQLQGAVKIMEKLNSLTFQKIGRIITAVDSQPTFDGGVLINVLGQLQVADKHTGHPMESGYRNLWTCVFVTRKNYITPMQYGIIYCLRDIACSLLYFVGFKCDDDPPHPYMQTFVLKPLGDSFFVQHDIFRLGIHDIAA